MTNTMDTIWLTPTAHRRLTDELAQLLRDPAPAPEVEARIHELQALIARAEVSEKPDDGLVEPGMIVTVRFDGDDEPTTFLFGPRAIAEIDPTVSLEVYTPESPLGAAINGRYPDDAFAYTAPSGAEVRGRILSASPYTGAPAS